MVVFYAMLIGGQSLITIPTSLQSVVQGQSAAFRVYAIINRVPEIDSENTGRRVVSAFFYGSCLLIGSGGIKKESFVGEIEFRNVVFHYPTRPDVPILKNLSLKVHPGQTVAFVG